MLKRMWSVYGTITILLFACVAGDYILNEHQSFILNEVTTVLWTCYPAAVALLNEKVFPILTGVTNQYFVRAHVAATEWGNGRIVAFGHSSFYINDLPEGIESDNVRLVLNSVDWARKNASNKIGVLAEKEIEDLLLEQGFDVHALTYDDVDNSTALDQFGLLVVTTWRTTEGLMNLRNFVKNGGGLLLGATGWTADPNDVQSFWGNVILRDTGIFYTTYSSYGSYGCNGKCFDTSRQLLADTNAFLTWEEFKEFDWNKLMSMHRISQLMEVFSDLFRFGLSDQELIDEVNDVAQRALKQIPTVMPTPTNPVIEENEKAYLIAYGHWIMLLNLIGKTSNIPPHPAAKSFPGTASLNSPIGQRIQEIVEIDGRRWLHSTGLYAQPGDEIKVQMLDEDTTVFDLEIQVGVHTDNLENLMGSWNRCPYIVFRQKIQNGTATIANPFGGLIFIASSMHRNVSLKFMIDGGIRSPSYLLGETNLVEWRNEIRNHPAPWGELVGRNIIISIQSSLLSQLDNPEEVIQTWDIIMDLMASLTVLSNDNDDRDDPPARFVADVQIGGGYMHSGYPIMFYLESQEQCINLTKMIENPWEIWGFLHELGHNHMRGYWIFDGSGDVINNLLPLYIIHTLFRYPTNSRPEFSDAVVEKAIKNYVENGIYFSQWQSDYNLAFFTYIQLQEAYGWSVYKNVFASFQMLPADELPKTDNEKIDMWMVLFSRVVKENMAEFFLSWGFPISSEAIGLVANLPPTTLRIPQL